MRIISGNFRGRKLTPLKGWTIRPTSDRVREAVFNILGATVQGCRVIDLFAGTGAVGLEALSRHALSCTFIDKETHIIEANIKKCQAEEQSIVMNADILEGSVIRHLNEKFDLIFMDPPYLKDHAEAVLNMPDFMKILNPNATIIVEHSHKEQITFLPKPLDILRQKKYSKTMISFIGRQP